MIIKPTGKPIIRLNSSERIYTLVKSIVDRFDPFDREKEHFWAIGLTHSLNLKYVDWVSMGTMHAIFIEPREVFRNAILHGASSIILVHNHPSDNLNPSEEDKNVTRQLVDAGKLLKIEVLDHLIIGSEGYYSFVDEELI